MTTMTTSPVRAQRARTLGAITLLGFSSGLATRKLSSQPLAGAGVSSPHASAIMPLSQARSVGKQPEFFWFEVQFLMSLRERTMFQSPHNT